MKPKRISFDGVAASASSKSALGQRQRMPRPRMLKSCSSCSSCQKITGEVFPSPSTIPPTPGCASPRARRPLYFHLISLVFTWFQLFSLAGHAKEAAKNVKMRACNGGRPRLVFATILRTPQARRAVITRGSPPPRPEKLWQSEFE
jgi:hypothetical protein